MDLITNYGGWYGVSYIDGLSDAIHDFTPDTEPIGQLNGQAGFKEANRVHDGLYVCLAVPEGTGGLYMNIALYDYETGVTLDNDKQSYTVSVGHLHPQPPA